LVLHLVSIPDSLTSVSSPSTSPRLPETIAPETLIGQARGSEREREGSDAGDGQRSTARHCGWGRWRQGLCVASSETKKMSSGRRDRRRRLVVDGDEAWACSGDSARAGQQQQR